MYTSFFGLQRNPFKLTPDPEFLFPSKEHQKALTYLNYGISSNTGFILVTGEVGTGKTTIIRKILKCLDEDIRIARVNNTLVTSEQLISMINDEFGLDTQGKDKTRMLRELSDFIISQYGQGFRTALIIDEAQNLSSELLEEIRLLSNLETDEAKLLQIILVGQPELKNILALPQLRQLRQRINISCHINPLNAPEMEDYVFHRLEVSGNRNAVSFEEGALNLIHDFSRGIPRLINIACDFSMLAAFSSETRQISSSMVSEVIEELESNNKYWHDSLTSAPGPEHRAAAPDHIGDIYSRIERLESSLVSIFSESGKKELLDRLEEFSMTEAMIKEALSNLQKETAAAKSPSRTERFEAISKNLSELKVRLDVLEQQSQAAIQHQGNGKKGLWKRFFAS